MTTVVISSATSTDVGYITGASLITAVGNAGGLLSDTANAWARFPAVGIPQGATVASATLALSQDNSYGSTVLLKVYANDTDDASAPTTVAGYTGKAVTAGVAWSPVPAASGTVSVDVTAAVQAVVDRSGWVSGNALMLLIKDNGSAAQNVIQFDGSTTGTAPSLTVDYSVAVTAPVGSSDGGVAWAGAATGTASHSGVATGRATWSGSASGRMTFTVTATVEGEDVVLTWPDRSATYAVERDSSIIEWDVDALTYTDTPGDGDHTYRVGVLG